MKYEELRHRAAVAAFPALLHREPKGAAETAAKAADALCLALECGPEYEAKVAAIEATAKAEAAAKKKAKPE